MNTFYVIGIILFAAIVAILAQSLRRKRRWQETFERIDREYFHGEDWL